MKDRQFYVRERWDGLFVISEIEVITDTWKDSPLEFHNEREAKIAASWLEKRIIEERNKNKTKV